MNEDLCFSCGRLIMEDEVPTFEGLCRECAHYQEQLAFEEWVVYGQGEKQKKTERAADVMNILDDALTIIEEESAVD